VAFVVGVLVLGGVWLWQRREQPSVHLSRGITLLHENRFDGAIAAFHDAIAAFREAIRLDPAGASAHYHLGNTSQQQARYEEAIAEYREAARERHDSAKAPISRRNVLDAIAARRELNRMQPE
jgi:tetratricopeptide (TPR) repeat protein